jgi:hypothetical protein
MVAPSSGHAGANGGGDGFLQVVLEGGFTGCARAGFFGAHADELARLGWTAMGGFRNGSFEVSNRDKEPFVAS